METSLFHIRSPMRFQPSPGYRGRPGPGITPSVSRPQYQTFQLSRAYPPGRTENDWAAAREEPPGHLPPTSALRSAAERPTALHFSWVRDFIQITWKGTTYSRSKFPEQGFGPERGKKTPALDECGRRLSGAGSYTADRPSAPPFSTPGIIPRSFQPSRPSSERRQPSSRQPPWRSSRRPDRQCRRGSSSQPKR